MQKCCTELARVCAKIAIQMPRPAGKRLRIQKNSLPSLRRSKPEHKMLWGDGRRSSCFHVWRIPPPLFHRFRVPFGAPMQNHPLRRSEAAAGKCLRLSLLAPKKARTSADSSLTQGTNGDRRYMKQVPHIGFNTSSTCWQCGSTYRIPFVAAPGLLQRQPHRLLIMPPNIPDAVSGAAPD